MAKQIASIHALIGANAAGFTSALDKIEAKAKGTERTVNSTKMVANVEAKTANLDRLQDRARQIDRARATMRVDADTKAATAKVNALQGLAKRPLMIGTALIMGAVMRALTASEEGKKFGEQLSRVALNVLAPLLKELTPVVSMLVPVAAGLGRAITDLGGWVRQLLSWVPPAPQVQVTGPSMFTDPTTFFGGLITEALPEFAAAQAAWDAAERAAREAGLAVGRFLGSITRVTDARDALERQLIGEAQQLAGVTPFEMQMAQYEEAFQQHVKTIQGGLNSIITNVPTFIGGGAEGWMAQAQQLLLADITAEHETNVRRLQEMQRELALIREMNQMRERATQLGERISPLQQFQRAIAEIERLDRREAFAGVENGRNEAMFRALETFRGQQPITVQPSVSIMERDATSTASAILAAQRAQRGQGTDLLADIRNLQREAAVRDERHIEVTREVARAIAALALPEPRELR